MKTLLLKIGLVGGMMLGLASFSANSQAYNPGYPDVTNISTTSATIEVNATIGGLTTLPPPYNYLTVATHYTYYLIEEEPSSSPSTDFIINNFNGQIGLEGPDETWDSELSSLSPNTNYFIHFVTTDNTGQVVIETSGTPTSVSFATLPNLSISTLTPPNNATNVPIDTDLTMTFSDDISAGSGYIEIHKGTSYSAINIANADISGNTLTLPATEFSLDYATDYHIEIEPGVIQGFSGITDADTWNFTTETGPPVWTVGPSLLNQSTTSVDLNGGTDQDGTCYYVVTEAFTPPSNTYITEGKDENGNLMDVSGSATLTANNTFTKNIDISILNSGVDYYIHILASNGTQFSENVVTKPLDLKAPSLLSSFSPTDNASGVLLGASITLPFNEKLYSTNATEITPENASTYFSIASSSGQVSFDAAFSNNDKTITLTPSKILEGSTTYTVSFLQKFEDIIGNEQSTKTGSFSFTTELANKWTGNGADSDWETPENWEGSYTSGNSISIPAGLTNYPVIQTGTSVTVNNLYVEPGASLTLNGGTLTINGLFVLQSSLESNASFIPADGTLNVDPQNVRFHQHIEANDRNYNIGVPVTGATKASAGITNYLYEYSNSNNTFIRVDEVTEMTPGKGYLCRSNNSLIFSGTPVTEDIQVTVYRNNSGGLGWNYIANPFSATMEFIDLGFNDTEIAQSFWIWNNQTGTYGTYNAASGVGTGIPDDQSGIPSHHGFWIKVLPGVSESQMTLNKSSLTTNNYSHLKSASGPKFPVFKLEALTGNKSDELAIVFAPDADLLLNDPYDTHKMLTTNPGFCQIFTKVNNENLAINGLPPSETELSILLNFKADQTGLVTLNVKEYTLDSKARILLEDTETHKFIDLSSQNTYEFEVTQSGLNTDRFILHISGTDGIATNINEPQKDYNNTKKASFYTNNSGIIAYIGQLNNPSYRLLDINGKIIDSGRLNPESENRIAVSRKGMVILIVESDNEHLEFKAVF
ncbi:Ig-like domain-containing protein [Marinilabilia salmonicolor]|nr:Ig-like domain-containing protein [Marinilabilia salmonicolor]